MPKKLHDCVRDIERRKGDEKVKNPWAVCNASIHGKTRHRKRRR